MISMANPAGTGPDPVLVNVADGIAWVTLNRPEKRNPISDPEMVSAVVSALASLADDPDRARVVILTSRFPWRSHVTSADPAG